jgi:DNA-binding transcriptional regulator PaaX
MEKETKEKVLSATKDVLLAIGILGFVFVAAGMGNAVQLLKYTPLLKKTKLKKFELNQALKRLISRGLIEIKEDKETEYLVLTPKGKRMLLKYQLEGLVSQKPKKWDKKYRIVIFDVAESQRKVRDSLRNNLKMFGFIPLQDSVWVYPYPCKEIIDLLKQYLDLNAEVIYMTADMIENDKYLREEFKI